MGGVWGRFWEGFRGFGGLLGNFLASFLHACIWNGLQKGSWRLLGSILAGFHWVWEGFWKGFGKDFSGFWAILCYSGLLSGFFLAFACYCLLLLVFAALSVPLLLRFCTGQGSSDFYRILFFLGAQTIACTI